MQEEEMKVLNMHGYIIFLVCYGFDVVWRFFGVGDETSLTVYN